MTHNGLHTKPRKTEPDGKILKNGTSSDFRREKPPEFWDDAVLSRKNVKRDRVVPCLGIHTHTDGSREKNRDET